MKLIINHGIPFKHMAFESGKIMIWFRDCISTVLHVQVISIVPNTAIRNDIYNILVDETHSK